jgi:hypothetical protein
LLVALTALGLGLRLAGAGALPWASVETSWLIPGRSPLAVRAVALAIGAATVPVAYGLLRGRGRSAAAALALLIATSPWHVHASRVAGPTTAVFLGMVVIAVLLTRPDPRGGRVRLRIAFLFAAICFAAATMAPASGARPDFGTRTIATLLAGDVGPAIPFLALLGVLRGAWPGFLAALVVGAPLHVLADKRGLGVDVLAFVLPAVMVVASEELGRWIAATESWRARIACALLAIVPGFPSLVSEHLDGGRVDLAPIARALERERRSGEPLYASDPALAEQSLGVEALPLSAIETAQPPKDRSEFVLLLLSSGAVRDGAGLPADFESRLSLVERAGTKRLDAGRFEARLYRRPPDSSSQAAR